MNPVKATMFALILLLGISPVAAEPVEPYSDPLPIGDYVEDVHGLLERAFGYSQWRLTPWATEDTFTGFLSHKGFDITVRIDVRDQAVWVSLESVHETGCSSDCRDLGEEKVLGWLVSLRRVIAYELTLLIRQRLLDQM
jgi:hypothetical protein